MTTLFCVIRNYNILNYLSIVLCQNPNRHYNWTRSDKNKKKPTNFIKINRISCHFQLCQLPTYSVNHLF